VLDQEQPGPQRDRLGRAVGHVKNGQTFRLLNPSQAFEQRVAIGQVERRDRLVAEQEPGLRGQRPGQPDPLALAAGERGRPAVEQVLDAAQRGDLGQSRRAAIAGFMVQSEADVRPDAEVREQQVVLKDHSDPSMAEPDVDLAAGVKQEIAAQDDPARVRPGQPGDQPQQGGLPRPRRPEDDADLAAERQRRVDRQPVVDAAGHMNFQDRPGVVQGRRPRSGRVHCTNPSAAIEISEIQSVSQAARVESPSCTAS